MEFYERASGARMHAAYVRPGGVALVSTKYISPIIDLVIYCKYSSPLTDLVHIHVV